VLDQLSELEGLMRRSMFGGVVLYSRGPQYYAVPLAVLESAEELVEWARKAITAASRPASRTGGSRKRR
jgi:TfoX/Sxy family transcriptional regulator of competence genes